VLQTTSAIPDGSPISRRGLPGTSGIAVGAGTAGRPVAESSRLRGFVPGQVGEDAREIAGRRTLTPWFVAGQRNEITAPGDGAKGAESDAVRALAASVADRGIITDRQALALVLADVEGVGRREAADRMDCSTLTLDTLLNRARSSVRDAAATLAILRELNETPAAAQRDE